MTGQRVLLQNKKYMYTSIAENVFVLYIYIFTRDKGRQL